MAASPPTQEEAPNCTATPRAGDRLCSPQLLWADAALPPPGLSEITAQIVRWLLMLPPASDRCLHLSRLIGQSKSQSTSASKGWESRPQIRDEGAGDVEQGQGLYAYPLMGQEPLGEDLVPS